MASNYLQIAQEIGRYIQTVENCGRVHLFIRTITETSRLKELLFDPAQGRICGWIITRESYKDDQLTNIDNLRVSTFVLRGYYSLEDSEESELRFQQWVDDISGAFRPQDNLNGTCETIYPVQARVLSAVTIGDALCHYCELTLDVQELFGISVAAASVGPTIEITAADTSSFDEGFLTATVTWGDGDSVEVFALAKLTGVLNAMTGYLRGEWNGTSFLFEDNAAAKEVFAVEGVAYGPVLFTVYAIDSNGMIATDTKSITFPE